MPKPIGRGRLLSLATFNLLTRHSEVDEITHEIGTHPWSSDFWSGGSILRVTWIALVHSDGSHRFYDRAIMAAVAHCLPRRSF